MPLKLLMIKGNEGILKVAKSLKESGLPTDLIVQTTELTASEIEKL